MRYKETGSFKDLWIFATSCTVLVRCSRNASEQWASCWLKFSLFQPRSDGQALDSRHVQRYLWVWYSSWCPDRTLGHKKEHHQHDSYIIHTSATAHNIAQLWPLCSVIVHKKFHTDHEGSMKPHSNHVNREDGLSLCIAVLFFLVFLGQSWLCGF